ncbi:DDE-domain-containing protein, partial [Zopfia rhizophila CBS 207.26]
KFKKRHGLKEHKSHGKIGSVPTTAVGEMQEVVTTARPYKEDDNFNIDETGLLEMGYLKGLGDKSRIWLALCTNASGSYKFKPWLIGKSKIPRALKEVIITALGAVWRASKKAWMNGEIFEEWLQTF